MSKQIIQSNLYVSIRITSDKYYKQKNIHVT